MGTETRTEVSVKQSVPFFMVANILESIRFYVDGLGFEVTNEWIDNGKLRWCWLRHGGGALMLQEFRKEQRDRITDAGKVLGVGVSIYFICDDAITIYRDATARGMKPGKPFVGNGMWVTSLLDPDGYNIFFESPTDELEETVYTEREE